MRIFNGMYIPKIKKVTLIEWAYKSYFFLLFLPKLLARFESCPVHRNSVLFALFYKINKT